MLNGEGGVPVAGKGFSEGQAHVLKGSAVRARPMEEEEERSLIVDPCAAGGFSEGQAHVLKGSAVRARPMCCGRVQ